MDLQAREVLLSIRLPWTRPHEFVSEFKQSHRRDDDIAIVNAGMRTRLRQGSGGECLFVTMQSFMMHLALSSALTCTLCNLQGALAQDLDSVDLSMHRKARRLY